MRQIRRYDRQGEEYEILYESLGGTEMYDFTEASA